MHDFPILLASCMKHNYSDFAVLAELVYVDSMQTLKDAGYQRPGLDNVKNLRSREGDILP